MSRTSNDADARICRRREEADLRRNSRTIAEPALQYRGWDAGGERDPRRGDRILNDGVIAQEANRGILHCVQLGAVNNAPYARGECRIDETELLGWHGRERAYFRHSYLWLRPPAS